MATVTLTVTLDLDDDALRVIREHALSLALDAFDDDAENTVQDALDALDAALWDAGYSARALPIVAAEIASL